MKVHAAYLAISVFICIWLASALVRVENHRYALQTGMCQFDGVKPIQPCLDRVQTRENWWGHLFYALFD